jgi:hypothetical protein
MEGLGQLKNTMASSGIEPEAIMLNSKSEILGTRNNGKGD